MATAWQVVPEAQTAMVMVAGLTVTNNCGTVLLGPFFSPYRSIAWPIYYVGISLCSDLCIVECWDQLVFLPACV